MLNILLVEDNAGDVVIVRELLRTTDLRYTFTSVTTLKETLILCVEHSFDVILIDLGLPDSQGLDALKKIHAFNILSPLIVMTGLDDESIALEALREGAQDYLVKNRLTADSIERSIKYGIERKRIQLLQKLYAHRISILSAASAALNESEDIPSLFRIICANLRVLLQTARILALEFTNEGIRLECSEWLNPWHEQIRSLTGLDLERTYLTPSEMQLKKIKSHFPKKLEIINDGLSGIFEDVISAESGSTFAKMFQFNHVYSIGFDQQGILFGGFLFFSQNIIGDDDIHIIENISNQISLNLQRRKIEKDLRLSEERFRMLNTKLEEKVTERTQALEKVNHRLNKELNDRIEAELALKDSENKLIELNAMKDKFFNIVAHDLKNPFTSLLGSSELLFQNIDLLDKENIRKLAIILNDSAKSGYAILQNLLDWSRSQTGLLKINLETLNLKTLVDENIANVTLFSSEKQIDLISSVDKNLTVFADKNMTNTVLRNLISNALKFSYRSGKVYIGAEKADSNITVTVEDQGTGIPKENLNKLFRIDSKYSVPGTENELGTGLGLKLSKEFVEKQGGKIWVQSKVNKGSVFKFQLPCQ